MDDEKKFAQLHEIVDRMLERHSRVNDGHSYPPFDITRQNIHDSKKAFRDELETISRVVDSLSALMKELFGYSDEAYILLNEKIDRIGSFVDDVAMKNRGEVKLETAKDLIIHNLRQTGFFGNSRTVIVEMFVVYRARRRELREQEIIYWSANHRAPNYYARAIALRLAQLYAREKQQFPTFGISREGQHPSTAFGRAVEEVFSVLEIGAHFRNPAEWAIAQLTEEDTHPKKPIERGILDVIERRRKG